MKSLWIWTKAKIGRLITATGVVLSGVEYFDITPIREPLESMIGHKGVQGVAVVLFIASFARHQLVANQHPKADPLPQPVPGAVVKP